ncbi:hypothetical protein ACC740_39230, partial [Rhizobium ruizarguesonis]
TYVPLVDVVLFLPLILICTRAVRAGDIRIHAGLAVAACGVLLLSCVSPRHMLGILRMNPLNAQPKLFASKCRQYKQ